MRGKHKIALLYLLLLSALAFQSLGHGGDRSDGDCYTDRQSGEQQCRAAPAVRSASASGGALAPRGGGAY